MFGSVASRLEPLIPSLPSILRCKEIEGLPDDALIDRVLARVPLAAVQLHGAESPDRVQAIKARTGCDVIKALQPENENIKVILLTAQGTVDTAV